VLFDLTSFCVARDVPSARPLAVRVLEELFQMSETTEPKPESVLLV